MLVLFISASKLRLNKFISFADQKQSLFNFCCKDGAIISVFKTIKAGKVCV